MYTKKYLLRIIKDLENHRYGITKNVRTFIENNRILQSKYLQFITKNSQSPVPLHVNEMLIHTILPMFRSSYMIDR